MKFILNTSLDPHFCAIFSDKNELIEKLSWTDRSQDGLNIYNFLAKQNPAKISFCGGISGPGGFASLRAIAGVLTSISIANDIGIHQISAEKFLFDILGHENFLLNSFGQSVWRYSSLNDEISREFLADIDKNKEWLIDFLPENKQIGFSRKIEFPLKNIEEKLLESLQKMVPQKIFSPHYEVPPISN
jgi:hypothetical protein